MVVIEVAREWHARPAVCMRFFAGRRDGCAARRLCPSRRDRAWADVPKLDRASLARLGERPRPRERDELYSAAVAGADVSRLRDAGLKVQSILLAAAHEWTAEFSDAAGAFLRQWT